MLGSNGFECCGDPFVAQMSALKHDLFQFQRFGEVDRARARFAFR